MILQRRCKSFLKCCSAAAALLACALTSLAQRPPAPRPGAAIKNQAASPAASETRFKGIWEPVNYPDDVLLDSVYFVNDKVGWAAGRGMGGIILHTSDGGNHWETQLGDPGSNEPLFDHLYFLDPSHGWAVQKGGKLVRTSDGANWEEAGSLPTQYKDYQFTSPRNGIETGGFYNDSKINVTADGGRTWKPVFDCVTTLQVQGLTKHVGCYVEDLHFPTSRVGYAVGGGFNGGFAVVAKTEDGGATWKLIFATTDMETADAVFFTDENQGVIRLRDRKLFLTSDGGQSWHGIPASASDALKFADPETGASCKGLVCSFTTDGGQHWLSRDFKFPASVEAFSIPRRDCIYVVGAHGMVYRYRVVPADYVAKNAIDAPLLSSYGGQINTDLERMKLQVKALQDKLAASASAQSPQLQLVAFRLPRRQTHPLTSPSHSAYSSAYGAPDSEPRSPFSPDFAQFQQSPATAGGFTQDTMSAPMSPAMQNCCAAEIQGLQTNVGSFSQQAPLFAGKFRNLNLIFVGMNMLSDLLGRAQAMRGSFLALKQAPNLQAANLALQNFSGQLQGTSQAVSSGFSQLSSSAAQGAAGTITNMVGSEAPNGASPAPAAAPPAAGSAAPGSSQQPNQNKSAKPTPDTAADKAKKKLKKIPWPN